MHPNSEEVLRGVAGALVTHVLPELQSQYARAQLMFSVTMLGVVANGLDGAAQQLIDDNASLRALALRAADALSNERDAAALRDDLRAAGAGTDTSLLLSDLSASAALLREAIARLGVFLEAAGAPSLRSLRDDVIETIRAQTEARALSLLGPRADG
jgi:hypothetical protein